MHWNKTLHKNPWVRNWGDRQCYTTSLDELVWKNTVQKRVAKWGQQRKLTLIVVALKWWSFPRWYSKLKDNDLRFIRHIKRLFQPDIPCKVNRRFFWSILKCNENPICDAFVFKISWEYKMNYFYLFCRW